MKRSALKQWMLAGGLAFVYAVTLLVVWIVSTSGSVVRLDLGSGRFEFVNAGHNPPFVRRADGTVECLRARHGLVLAAADVAKYRSAETTLGKGDTLLLYTDGVTEAGMPQTDDITILALRARGEATI